MFLCVIHFGVIILCTSANVMKSKSVPPPTISSSGSATVSLPGLPERVHTANLDSSSTPDLLSSLEAGMLSTASESSGGMGSGVGSGMSEGPSGMSTSLESSSPIDPVAPIAAPSVTDKRSMKQNVAFVMGVNAGGGKASKDPQVPGMNSTNSSLAAKIKKITGKITLNVVKKARKVKVKDIKEVLAAAGVRNVTITSKCHKKHRKSTVIAVILGLFFTPIAERYYLGYRLGPSFALLIFLVFGAFIACGTGCVSFSVSLLPPVKEKKRTQWKSAFTNCGMAMVVLSVIYLISIALWALIDFSLLVTHRMKDAHGCPLH